MGAVVWVVMRTKKVMMRSFVPYKEIEEIEKYNKIKIFEKS